MKTAKQKMGDLIAAIENRLPLSILMVLLLLTYAKFSAHPYQGFRVNTDGSIAAIYIEQREGPTLKIGDKLLQVGTTTWRDFQANLWNPFFSEVRPGNLVPLLLQHGNQQITIYWRFPGSNQGEVTDLLVNEGWLAFVFWLAGTVTALSLRPKNQLWRLMFWFNYLTSLWLATGSGLSFYHIWGTAIMLRALVWLSVPVYLHLHWVYPAPFKKLPKIVVWTSYLAASGLAVAEWFQILPRSLYLLGFFIGVGGSVILLIAHAVFQPATRRDLRLIVFAALLAFSPAILVGFFGAFSTLPYLAGAGTVGLPFLPWIYFYTAYRRQLGDLEVRINRLVLGYLFVIAVAILFLIFITIAGGDAKFSGATISVGLIVAIFSTSLSIWLFPSFQSLAERRLLGIRLAPAQLQETYSARITTSTSLSTLQTLITNDILPSLLVREFMFLQFDENSDSPKIFFAVGVSEDQAPQKTDISKLIATSGSYRPLILLPGDQPNRWIRLALPLKIGAKLTGLWLFGRRDPDDLYSQREIPTLQSLANQMAIAQSNILQTDRLKSLYLLNIARTEEEHLNLALELHDSILNQIAALAMSLDFPLPPVFQENYEKLTQDVREIVSNLRPPMLNYGLKLAMEELVENLTENPRNMTSITLEITADNRRYPQNIEQHIFRIVQEACSNALRHAKAKNIRIVGLLTADEISLQIEDDGIGFQVGEDLDNLLINKHFGLAGMKERAELIGADFHINSAPVRGTCIAIRWENPAEKNLIAKV